MRQSETPVKLSDLEIMSANAQTERQRGCTATLVLCGIDHHTVSVPGLTHLKATAIQDIMAVRPVLVLAAYLAPSRPMIGAHITARFGVDCRRSQRQTRGLELAASLEMRNSYVILPMGTPV
jgi:hypothetical protein